MVVTYLDRNKFKHRLQQALYLKVLALCVLVRRNTIFIPKMIR